MDKAEALSLWQRMLRIRVFEERLSAFYDYRGYTQTETIEEELNSAEDLLTCVSYEFVSHGMIGGAVHLSVGQEAVSTGVCAHLNNGDAAFSSHRSHGHFLAKGGRMDEALAELMGRVGGCSKGCGGSMHLFSRDITFLGGNGIIGAQLSLGLGPAFASKYRGEDHVSVPFFGDGGANQGTFTEAMNLAALWQLPVVFVCENNLYANTTPSELSFAEPDLAGRARSYGVLAETVDGQDLEAVYEVAGKLIQRAREGGGPGFIEAQTYRFYGHCGGTSAHRSPEECERWKQRDPLLLFEPKIRALGATDIDFDDARAAVDEEWSAAKDYALASPLPDPHSLQAV